MERKHRNKSSRQLLQIENCKFQISNLAVAVGAKEHLTSSVNLKFEIFNFQFAIIHWPIDCIHTEFHL